MGERRFNISREQRDAQFRSKDEVTLPLLRSIQIRTPRRFHAVLMPSLFGPEVFALRAQEVPPGNIFVIERDRETHRKIRHPGADLEHLKGVRTTLKPLALHLAIDRIPFPQLDLVYLDLYGQLDADHYVALYRLFRLHRLPPGALFLLTCGQTRGDPFSCRVNADLVSPTGRAYIESAIRQANHQPYRNLTTHGYVSGNLAFEITAVNF